MRRLTSTVIAILLTLTVLSPVAAAGPTVQNVSFTAGPYVFAECDGYDVMEQIDVEMRIVSYVDSSGSWVRDVTHGSSTGGEWRSDTGDQIATYSDAGGTFTAAADGTFTWTGIHNRWTTTSGLVIKDRGRVVVAEVAPGDFERIFEAGQIPEPDPCSW